MILLVVPSYFLLLHILCISSASLPSPAATVSILEELSTPDNVLNKLNTDDGKTPCFLSHKCVAPCSNSTKPANMTMTSIRFWTVTDPDSDQVSPFPVPSLCTCNNVFFNIWSACLLTIGNRTDPLPRYDHWQSQCANASVTVTDGFPDSVAQNITIPHWAYLGVPSSTSRFDVIAALNSVNTQMQSQSPPKQQRRWTTTQILLPVLAAIGSALACLTGYLLYHYRSNLHHRLDAPLSSSWNSATTHFFRFKTRIQSIRRANSGNSLWTLDPCEETADFVRVSGPRRGHYRLTSHDPLLPADGEGHESDLNDTDNNNHDDSIRRRRWRRRRVWRSSPSDNILVPLRRLSQRVSSTLKSSSPQWFPNFRSTPSNGGRFTVKPFITTGGGPTSADASYSRASLSTADLRAGMYTRPVPPDFEDDEDLGLLPRPNDDDDDDDSSSMIGIAVASATPVPSLTLTDPVTNPHLLTPPVTPTRSGSGRKSTVGPSTPKTPPLTPPLPLSPRLATSIDSTTSNSNFNSTFTFPKPPAAPTISSRPRSTTTVSIPIPLSPTTAPSLRQSTYPDTRRPTDTNSESFIVAPHPPQEWLPLRRQAIAGTTSDLVLEDVMKPKKLTHHHHPPSPRSSMPLPASLRSGPYSQSQSQSQHSRSHSHTTGLVGVGDHETRGFSESMSGPGFVSADSHTTCDGLGCSGPGSGLSSGSGSGSVSGPSGQGIYVPPDCLKPAYQHQSHRTR